MEDWNKYLPEEILAEEEILETTSEHPVQIEDDRIALSVDSMRDFCERLSGKDTQGLSKSVISYQTYDSGISQEVTTDKNAEIIYNCTKASIDLSFDALNPGLLLLTLTFPTHDDPELRLFWARLQKWRRRDSGQEVLDENTVPIFLIHLFERNSIDAKTDIKENILEANILNPLICYLTRETPTSPAIDHTNEKGETMGGNVIKMLCNMEFVTFSLIEDVDTSDIKAEVLREKENERYITAENENADTSSAYNLN